MWKKKMPRGPYVFKCKVFFCIKFILIIQYVKGYFYSYTFCDWNDCTYCKYNPDNKKNNNFSTKCFLCYFILQTVCVRVDYSWLGAQKWVIISINGGYPWCSLGYGWVGQEGRNTAWRVFTSVSPDIFQCWVTRSSSATVPYGHSSTRPSDTKRSYCAHGHMSVEVSTPLVSLCLWVQRVTPLLCQQMTRWIILLKLGPETNKTEVITGKRTSHGLVVVRDQGHVRLMQLKGKSLKRGLIIDGFCCVTYLHYMERERGSIQ